MERFIPVESFRKKGNTFWGISFFSLLPEFPKIVVPFVHPYSARLFTVILPRKNAKDLKYGGRFPKGLSYNVCLCSSVVLSEVLEQNCNPAGENELIFVVGTWVFFYLHDSGFQRASAWATSWEKNVDADCWFPWRDVDAAAAKRRKSGLLLPKKKKIFQVVW